MGPYDRDFKGVWIPRAVWLDERLNALEKVILIEIDSLDKTEEDGCWAGNDYIAEFCQCSASAVSKAISKLKKFGYIYEFGFDGRKRRLRSCLTVSEAEMQNIRGSLVKSAKQKGKNDEAGEQILRQIKNNSNTKTNTKDKEGTKRKRFTPPTLEEVEKYCSERKNNINPSKFMSYYESNGWRVGKNPMKDWKATVRSWEAREKDFGKPNKIDTSEDWSDDLDGYI